MAMGKERIVATSTTSLILMLLLIVASFCLLTIASETQPEYLNKAFARSFNVTLTVQNVHFLFQIDNIDLETVSPNRTVVTDMHLRFNSTGYYLVNLNFSEPFQSWFVQSNFTKGTYLPYSSNGTANFNLTFQIPAKASEGRYTGNITIAAEDTVSASLHEASGNISATIGEISSSPTSTLSPSPAIPEFPLRLILPFLMATMVLSAVLIKKRREPQ